MIKKGYLASILVAASLMGCLSDSSDSDKEKNETSSSSVYESSSIESSSSSLNENTSSSQEVSSSVEISSESILTTFEKCDAEVEAKILSDGNAALTQYASDCDGKTFYLADSLEAGVCGDIIYKGYGDMVVYVLGAIEAKCEPSENMFTGMMVAERAAESQVNICGTLEKDLEDLATYQTNLYVEACGIGGNTSDEKCKEMRQEHSLRYHEEKQYVDMTVKYGRCNEIRELQKETSLLNENEVILL